MKKQYTKEQDKWLRDNFYNYKKYPTYVELASGFNSTFGVCKKGTALSAYCRNALGIKRSSSNSIATPVQIEWVKSNAMRFKKARPLYDAFMEEFGEDSCVDVEQIRHLAKYYVPEWECDRLNFRFSASQEEWLKNISINGRTAKEIADEFNSVFGTELSTNYIYRKMNALGVAWSNEDRISIVRNAKNPIGTEHVQPDGFIVVKTKKGHARAEYKQRIVWEEHCGKIPEGYVIVFADGNRSNCDINNLRCVKKSVAMSLIVKNNYGLREITDVCIDIANAREAIRKEEARISGESSRHKEDLRNN